MCVRMPTAQTASQRAKVLHAILCQQILAQTHGKPRAMCVQPRFMCVCHWRFATTSNVRTACVCRWRFATTSNVRTAPLYRIVPVHLLGLRQRQTHGNDQRCVTSNKAALAPALLRISFFSSSNDPVFRRMEEIALLLCTNRGCGLNKFYQ